VTKSKQTSLLVVYSSVLRKIRLDLEISQEMLAELAGLDRTYISGIERCKRNLTIGSLEKIISGLGITHKQFLLELNKYEEHSK
jgi:transcriptional regulator with XRE-family HTH domain